MAGYVGSNYSPNNYPSVNQVSFPSGGVELSQSTIMSLANSMSTSLSGVMRSLLPMIASAVSSAAGFVNGTNSYTQAQFLRPIAGDTPFSAHHAENAYALGLINKNAYLHNYARTLGFSGSPAELSSYMQKMPGGMEMMEGGLERAWSIANRRTNKNPLFEMQAAYNKRWKTTSIAQKDLIVEAANDTNLGLNVPDDGFTNVKQVRDAIAATYGDIESGGNAAWKALKDEAKKEKIRKISNDISTFDQLRMGVVDADRVATEQRYRKDEPDRARAKNMLSYARTRLEQVNKDLEADNLDPDKRDKLEERRDELIAMENRYDPIVEAYKLGYRPEELKADAVKAEFDQLGVGERTFRIATLADMAITRAAASTDEQDQLEVASGNMTKAEYQRNFATRNMIISAGGIENARAAAAEVLSSIDFNNDEDLIKSIGAGLVKAGNTYKTAAEQDTAARSALAAIEKGILSPDSTVQTGAIQDLITFLSAAREGDRTGFVRSTQFSGRATALAGGDSQAAEDVTNMIKEIIGKDFSQMNESDFVTANKYLSYVSETGSPKKLAETTDSVTRALQRLGVSTTDVTGKQTSLVNSLTSYAVDLKTALTSGGTISGDAADNIINESITDLMGSKSGRTLARFLDIADVFGYDKEKIDSIGSDMAQMTPDEMRDYLREKGMGEIVDYDMSLGSAAKAKIEEQGYIRYVANNDALKLKFFGASQREAMTDSRFLGQFAPDALKQIEGLDRNDEMFKNKAFQQYFKLANIDVTDKKQLDQLPAEIRQFIDNVSGLGSEERFLSWIKRNPEVLKNLNISYEASDNDVRAALDAASNLDKKAAAASAQLSTTGDVISHGAAAVDAAAGDVPQTSESGDSNTPPPPPKSNSLFGRIATKIGRSLDSFSADVGDVKKSQEGKKETADSIFTNFEKAAATAVSLANAFEELEGALKSSKVMKDAQG